MTPAEEKRLSKFLSLVLRHEPDAAGVDLDPAGWVEIEALIAGAGARGTRIARADLDHVVAHSEKKRFTLSADGLRIRAAQGHSVPVDLGLEPTEPPEILYHGTAETTVPKVLAEGLKPRSRQHVHLSADTDTARRVGQRHGRPVVLEVAAGLAQGQGQLFWRAENGVWLSSAIAPRFLSVVKLTK